MSTQLADSPAMVPSARSPIQVRSRIGDGAGPLMVLVVLTIVGGVIRAIVANQSIFADELSTYWISATHSLGGVVSLMYGTPHIQHAEITPPVYFLAAWLTSHIGSSVFWLRLPAFLGGVASIPLVYVLGERLIGRRAALVAATLTTLSPFMIYYSAEARAYGVMMALLLGSTLSMLLAVQTGRRRWWVLYAACSWSAFLSHYTCAFVLAAQLLWVLWAHPGSRRPAVIANVGAALAVLPWLPGLIQDLTSPTLKILSVLSPFNPGEVGRILGHWSVGYPYTFSETGLSSLPAAVGLGLLGFSVLVAVAGGLSQLRGASVGARLRTLDRRVLLTGSLAVATPVCEAVASLTGNHLFGVRNLAASWPYLAMVFALLLTVSGRRVRVLACALAILGFAWSATKMLSANFDRPDYDSAIGYIEHAARPGDVVVDETGALSPGPLTAVDVLLHRPLTVVRAAAPAERGHPFTFFDRMVTVDQALRTAITRAHGGRVFVIWSIFHTYITSLAERAAAGLGHVPAPYRAIGQHSWAGIGRTVVAVLAQS